MGVDSPAYDAVLVAHIVCAIVGFGAVALNGLYGLESKRRPGAAGLAIFEATEKVAKVAEMFIFAVPVLGVALVLMSHHRWGFSQAWVLAALIVFAAALALVFGLHRPNLARMGTLTRELVSMSEPAPTAAGARHRGSAVGSEEVAEVRLPPQAQELETRGRRAGAYGAALNLALVVMVVLMVWKPGS